MSDLLCLFMVVMANMVVWVVLAVVRADIVMVVIVSQIDLHIDQASSEKIEQAHVAKANPCSCPISDSLPLTLHACYFLEQEFSANFSFCGGCMCTCFLSDPGPIIVFPCHSVNLSLPFVKLAKPEQA